MGKQLIASNAMLEENLTMTDATRQWANSVGILVPIRGTGSPEAVVSAGENAQYIDTTGSPGSLLYIKVNADIGGDTSQGWVLV